MLNLGRVLGAKFTLDSALKEPLEPSKDLPVCKPNSPEGDSPALGLDVKNQAQGTTGRFLYNSHVVWRKGR